MKWLPAVSIGLVFALILPITAAVAGRAKQPPPRLGQPTVKESTTREFSVAGLRLGMTFKEVTEAVDKLQADKARATTKQFPLPNGQMLEWVDTAQVVKVDGEEGSIQIAMKFAPPVSMDSAEALMEIRFEEVQSKSPANGKYIKDLTAYVTERYGVPSEEQVTYKCRIGTTGKILGPADREPVAEIFDQISWIYYLVPEPKKDSPTLRVDLGISCQRIIGVLLADDRIRQERDEALAAYLAQARQDVLRGEAPPKKPRF